MKSINNIKSSIEVYSDDDEGYTNVTNKRNKSSLKNQPQRTTELPQRTTELPQRTTELPQRTAEQDTNMYKNVSFANEAQKRGRDLSALGDDVQRSREIYNEKQESRQNRTRYQPAYLREEPKVVEEKVIKMNIDDATLFPTLNINNIVAPKKLSAWNTFKVDTLIEKVAQTEKDAETQKQLNIKMNLSNSNTNKDLINESVRNVYVDSDGDEYYSDNNDEDDEEGYDDTEMDSLDIYMHEKYIKRDELYNNIRFVKSKFNKYNLDHINYLRRLQMEYATIDDEIYRHEQDENALEREYGSGSYSLLDEAKRKREELEEKKKEPERVRDFLKMLASVK